MPNIVPTKQTMALAEALNTRGLYVKTEHYDGHKHVDIFIPAARLYIEVDGPKHYLDPKQIIADFKRDHFSDGDDFHTMRLTNEAIEAHLIEIADAITQVAKSN